MGHCLNFEVVQVKSYVNRLFDPACVTMRSDGVLYEGFRIMHWADVGGGCRGCVPPEITCGFLIQLVFCKKKSVTPFLTGAPPPKKNPGSAPDASEQKSLLDVHIPDGKTANSKRV